MSGDIRDWLAQAVVKHNKFRGANLDVFAQGQHVQILDFLTRRTPQNPHAQIEAIVSDEKHRIRVRFDIVETDEYERKQSSLGSLAEPLTSHVRAVVELQVFKFALLPPPKATGPFDAVIPELVLDVSKWEIISGDHTETVYYPEARSISEESSSVFKILEGWWNGANGRDDIVEEVNQEWAKRIAAKSTTPEDLPGAAGVPMDMSSIYSPYGSGKDNDVVHDKYWIIPEDQLAVLKSIKVFGQDPVKFMEEEEGDLNEGVSAATPNLAQDAVVVTHSAPEGNEGGWSGVVSAADQDTASSQPREQTPAEDASEAAESIVWSPTPPPQAPNGDAYPSQLDKSNLVPTVIMSTPSHRQGAEASSRPSPSLRALEQTQHLSPHYAATPSSQDAPEKVAPPMQTSDFDDADDELPLRPQAAKAASRRLVVPASRTPGGGIAGNDAVFDSMTDQGSSASLPETIRPDVGFSLARKFPAHDGSRHLTGVQSKHILVPDSDRDVDDGQASTLLSSSLDTGEASSRSRREQLSAGYKRKRVQSSSPAAPGGLQGNETSMEADDEATLPEAPPTKKLSRGVTVSSPSATASQSRGGLLTNILSPVKHFFQGSAPASVDGSPTPPATSADQPTPNLLARFMPGPRARDESDSEPSQQGRSASPARSAVGNRHQQTSVSPWEVESDDDSRTHQAHGFDRSSASRQQAQAPADGVLDIRAREGGASQSGPASMVPERRSTAVVAQLRAHQATSTEWSEAQTPRGLQTSRTRPRPDTPPSAITRPMLPQRQPPSEARESHPADNPQRPRNRKMWLKGFSLNLWPANGHVLTEEVVQDIISEAEVVRASKSRSSSGVA